MSIDYCLIGVAIETVERHGDMAKLGIMQSDGTTKMESPVFIIIDGYEKEHKRRVILARQYRECVDWMEKNEHEEEWDAMMIRHENEWQFMLIQEGNNESI